MAERQQPRGTGLGVQYEDFVPKYEWKDQPEATLLTIDLPDFTKEQIKVKHVHASNKLRVTGERPLAGQRWSRFNKVFTVPHNCLVDKLHKRFNNNTLTITMPKETISNMPNLPETYKNVTEWLEESKKVMLRKGLEEIKARRQQRGTGLGVQHEDFVPKFHWKDQPEATLLIIDLPGFTNEQIKIRYLETSNKLRVKGERPLAGHRWSRFREVFHVPHNCLVDKIHWNFSNNSLTITMPKGTVTKTPYLAESSKTVSEKVEKLEEKRLLEESRRKEKQEEAEKNKKLMEDTERMFRKVQEEEAKARHQLRGTGLGVQHEDFVPNYEWKEKPEATLLIIDLPGFTNEQIKIRYLETSNKLRVKGERPLAGHRWSRFREVFHVPHNCLVDKIHWNFSNNSLTITMPKGTVTKTPYLAESSKTVSEKVEKLEEKRLLEESKWKENQEEAKKKKKLMEDTERMLRKVQEEEAKARQQLRGTGLGVQHEDFVLNYEWKEKPEATLLIIDLPGFTNEQIKIRYLETSNKLRVKGERPLAGHRWSRFREVFHVPHNCLVDKIHWNFSNNSLTITMPKGTVTKTPYLPGTSKTMVEKLEERRLLRESKRKEKEKEIEEKKKFLEAKERGLRKL